MTSSTENKIFISWSGETSPKIAVRLKDWLEEVVDGITVWVSHTDSDPGSRSVPDIERALTQAIMGIVVTTPSTMGRDWINFEAGALSKEVGGKQFRVIPLLVGFDSPRQLVGPLAMFQAVVLSREGLQRLLRAIYRLLGGVDRSATRLEKYWPLIEREVQGWHVEASPYSGEAKDNHRETAQVRPEILLHAFSGVTWNRSSSESRLALARDPARAESLPSRWSPEATIKLEGRALEAVETMGERLQLSDTSDVVAIALSLLNMLLDKEVSLMKNDQIATLVVTTPRRGDRGRDGNPY